MIIYVIFSNYFDSGVFGTYSSIKRARIAFEHFLTEDKNIVAFKDLGGYSYEFTTENDYIFFAKIDFDVLDAEFEEGICKED